MSEIAVSRIFEATPERIWEAWTTPEQLHKFFASAGSHVPLETVTMDIRVGGAFSLEMRNDENGEIYLMHAEYTELERPRRLGFRTSGRIDGLIELEDLGSGKTLLTWTTMTDFGGDDGYRRDAITGTHSAVDNLGELLDSLGEV